MGLVSVWADDSITMPHIAREHIRAGTDFYTD
jgi:hypothetical protein